MRLLPGAVEPADFTATTDEALLTAPGVEWDGNGQVDAGSWVDGPTVRPRRFSVDVAHPTATPDRRGAARVLAVGTHRARLHVTDGPHTYVRDAPDTLVVSPAVTGSA